MRFLDARLFIGEHAAEDLVQRFGSPLYVYDATILRKQIAALRAAFAAIPLTPFYAVKANDNLAFLRMFRAEGLGCDAVSPGEVFLAKKAGFDGSEIWFTCSNVSDDDLLALDDPAIVINVNSMSEIDRCVRLRLLNRIAIRVNPDVGAGHHRDVVTGGLGVKFGIDLAELDAARGTAEAGGLTVAGLHAHIGSGITSVEPLLESARTLIEASKDFPYLRWLNFGGGIAVPYKPGEKDFPLADYGRSLSDIAGETLRRRGIRAILEPGRFLAAQSGVLLARVTSKRISAGNEWIGCDTGMNHLARPSRYGSYHHILNASRGDDRDLRENAVVPRPDGHEAVVAGNICESGDVFTKGEAGPELRSMPPVKLGDILAFCDAGAYGFSMASHYNARLLPAEVLVEGSEVRVIRKRQEYADLLRGQDV